MGSAKLFPRVGVVGAGMLRPASTAVFAAPSMNGVRVAPRPTRTARLIRCCGCVRTLQSSDRARTCHANRVWELYNFSDGLALAQECRCLGPVSDAK